MSVTDSFRWPSPSAIHLTLKFLGEVTNCQIGCIEEQLRTVRVKPFKIKWSSLEFPPNTQVPRTLWLAVHSKRLEELADRINEEIIRLGIPNEERPFGPHLTSARRRRNCRISSSFIKKVKGYDKRVLDPYSLDRFYLAQSILRPEGAEYKSRFEYPLIGPNICRE